MPVKIEQTDWITSDKIKLPEDTHLYVIGDVHGCRDNLKALFDEIPNDSDVTMLGDLGDRGPDSPGTFRLVAEESKRFKNFTFLPGNHEQFLIGACIYPKSEHTEILYSNGGDWVVDNLHEFDTLMQCVLKEIGPDAWRMITQDYHVITDQSYQLHRRVGNVLMVHAGVLPNVNPDYWIANCGFFDNDDIHPLWIRYPFLRHNGPYWNGTFVVHGHTPECKIERQDRLRAKPGVHEIDGWRLGIDGGSYATKIVTMAELKPNEYRITTAHMSKEEID
jgi:serine/threonine protein phosphatase 1